MAEPLDNDELVAFDPYALPPGDIEEPPATMWAALRKIGPGIILAGTIVGSGELILTTSLGAEYGYVFLWLILFSCVIKVFVQIELGRYAISSGKPTLGMLNDLPGRTLVGHPLIWWWLVMMSCTVFQLGAMTGSVGQAINLAFPEIGAWYASTVTSFSPGLGELTLGRPEFPWAVLTCFVTMALIFRGGYRRIEWLTTLIVVSVTLITVTAAMALSYTEYPVNSGELLSGLKVTAPRDGIGKAFAVFGITGVGASELFFYPYWCLEKGYARFVGRRDDSEAWARRARGWIKVLHLDAWVSMVVFTISTIAFYVMGAAVLRPQGLNPKGADMIDTLSNMYVGPFGMWTRILFLIGASAVLFKTLYLSSAANSRLTADFLVLTGFAKSSTAERRVQIIRRLCLFFPTVALLLYVLVREPKLMVTIGGIAQGATIPMITLAAVYFRYTRVDKRVTPWKMTDALLWIAVIAILVVSAYAVPTQLVDLIGKIREALATPAAP